MAKLFHNFFRHNQQRFCSIRSNADPCVSSDTQHFICAFNKAVLELELALLKMIRFLTLATSPESESGGIEVFDAVSAWCSKCSFVRASSLMGAVMEIREPLNLRR